MRMLLACLSFVVFAPLATARNLRHRRPMWAGRVLFPTSGPTGKPCLDVGARSRPHTINPNLYDHAISATNRCVLRLTILTRSAVGTHIRSLTGTTGVRV
jgi:hypothetical protein